MPRGSTKSKLSLSERREFASELFEKGFTVSDVARKLKVTWDTAKGYKQWWEDRLAEVAQANPAMLQDVLLNTVQSLAELDRVRAAAWRTYHTAESRQLKLQALNTIRQCQQDKAKLFGLFGVKQDFYMMVANVKVVQDRLLGFMRDELCEGDRAKLERFLTSPEMRQYMGLPELPSLPEGDDDIEDAEIIEDVA